MLRIRMTGDFEKVDNRLTQVDLGKLVHVTPDVRTTEI